MKTAHLLEQYEEAGAFFPVHQEDLQTVKGTAVPRKKANIRSDTGELLGVVGSKYKVIDYRDGVVLPALKALENSGLDLTDSSARVEFAENGGRMLSVISLPAHTTSFKLPSKNKKKREDDVSQLQMLLRSGHDAVYPVDVRPGAIRMACLNGMYNVDAIGRAGGKHTSRFDSLKLQSQIGGLLASFEKQAENWAYWSTVPVNDADAWHALQLYTWTKKEQIDRGLEVYTERGRVTKAVKLMDDFVNRDKVQIGATAWGLYNTMTFDATHSERPEGKVATSSDLRHGNVKRVVASDVWQDLLAA